MSLPRHQIGKLEAWEIEQNFGTLTLRFGGNRRLTIQDETVLLAILNLMGQDGLFLAPDITEFHDVRKMERQQAAANKVGVATQTRWKLLALCGLPDSQQGYAQLERSLERLSSVVVHYRNEATKWRGSDWFLSYMASEDGHLNIQVNWRLAGAVFGDYHYVSLDMHERLALSTDYAKKLHVVLSRQVWHGQTVKFRLDTLVNHVWQDGDVTPGTIRNRRSDIKKGLIEIGGFEAWSIAFAGRGDDSSVEVTRAFLPKDRKKSARV